jgi:predicted permease
LTQLLTLIWLKWTLFRNALRSRKATLNQAASILGTLAALAFSLVIALGLGIATYVITSETGAAHIEQARAASRGAAEIPPPSFILFMIFSFIYMLWATLPLSIGGGSQFDPGRLLMYPISLRKLFALDVASELTTLSSLFAVPSILAMAVGAGLAMGSLGKAIAAATLAILLGIALAKWLATSIGALIKKRRTRGETLLALIGALAGLSGAFIGQLWPIVMQHQHWFRGLRWTPPGAIATALTDGLGPSGAVDYATALVVLVAYALILIFATFWVAQRAVLGRGEGGRRKSVPANSGREAYSAWQLPLVSDDLAAIVEKESRYALRNAQLRMLALMPLILLAVRFMNTRGFGQAGSLSPDAAHRMNDFLYYGEGLMATAGVLYVFVILSGVACNSFAFESGGMRTLILSPIERRKVLIGKNLVITVVCLVFSLALLLINQLIFRDLTLAALLFVILSFVVFAVFISITGNWFSIRFPKPMKFGKRMNVSGVAGLLLLPLLLLMALPPLAATAVGYLSQSLLVEYVTLALFAAFAFLIYFPIVRKQGNLLERHERTILETVSKDLEI